MIKKMDIWLEKCAVWLAPLFEFLSPLGRKGQALSDKFISWLELRFPRVFEPAQSERLKIIAGKKTALYHGAVAAAAIAEVLLLAFVSPVLFWIFAIIGLPLAWLVWREYRMAAFWLSAFQIICMAGSLVVRPEYFLLEILFGLLFFLVCFICFRYDNAKAKLLGKSVSDEKNKKYKDASAVLISACMLFVAFLLTELVSPGAKMPVPEVPVGNHVFNRRAGVISRSLFGYTEFCRKQNYELKIYPQAFAKRYAGEIAEVEKELSRDGLTLSDYYNNAKRIYGRRLDESIASEMDILRRQAIVELVALNRNIRPSQVRWLPEMDGYISMTEACVLFDEIAENTLNAVKKDMMTPDGK